MALVKLMHHDAAQTGGPLTADVPEVAVPIWLECGWRRAREEESAPIHEESVPASSESAPEPVQEAPAPAPEPRKRGRKKTAAA